MDLDGIPLLKARRDRQIGASLGVLISILDLAIATWSGRDEMGQAAAVMVPAMLVVGWIFAPRALGVTWRGSVTFAAGMALLLAAIAQALRLTVAIVTDIGVPIMVDATALVDNIAAALLVFGAVFLMLMVVTWVWTLPFALLWVVGVRIAGRHFGEV